MRMGRGKPGSMRMSWSSVSGSWSSSRRRASLGYASQKRSSTRHSAVTACLTRRTWPGEMKCGIRTNGIVWPLKTTSCSESQLATSDSRPAQESPSLESSTRYWSLRLLTWSIRAALTLLPHRQRHPITDRKERGAKVLAGREPRVERAHRVDVVPAPRAGRLAGRGRAGHQHVVDEQHAARAQELDDLLEVPGVAVLRAVDEGEVEGPRLELGEALGGVLEAEVDLVLAAVAGEVDLGVLVTVAVDLERRDVCAAAGEVQRRDADGGTDFDRLPASGRRGERLEQPARGVEDDRDPVARAVRAHLRQQRIRLRL